MGADRAVLALAARQHGAVSLAQLLAAGLTRDAVRHRVALGWLTRRHRGVYLVGPLRTPFTAAMAAVLACGEDALLSHASAAAVWRIAPFRPGGIEVTVPGRNPGTRPGVRLHRPAFIDPRDATRRHAIPITSPARTLLDLAPHLSSRDLARAAEEARVQRLVTDRSLDEQFRRYPAHRGAAALKATVREDPAFTRSEAERRLLELIRAARLPTPEVNARVGAYEVDFLWREQRLVVEVDGYAFHSSRRAFERDRRRDADLAAGGIRVMRATWRQIAGEREALVARFAAALAV